MTRRTVLRGGTVVDGTGSAPRYADLAHLGERISEVGEIEALADDQVIDCTGRLVLPGMIDTHTHADAQVFDASVAHALLRQGLTTVIAGQDGVSYAPGDGRYATRYFAAINGTHPTYAGGGVAELIAGYDGSTPLNVGYLVPAGTVREMIMGFDRGRPSATQLAQMQALVDQGLSEGALGLSSGLDYLPGCFADAAELTEMCRPVAAAGGIYVTHMRGGYEENSAAGLDEVIEICTGSGVRSHISHFHARSDLITDLIDDAAARIDLTFDSYPYSRGCSLLAMPLLPPSVLERGFDACVRDLGDEEMRREIERDWIPVLAARADMGPAWASNLRFSHIAAPEYAWAHGLSLADAAVNEGLSPGELGLRVLAASALEVSVVMTTPVERTDAEMAPHLGHRLHMGGSDGIFVGRNPHPRGWGAFARYLSVFTAERGDLSWSQAAERLSAAPARRFGLADRGILGPGAFADVIVVDPATIQAGATYQAPRTLASGIDDVFVNGEQVLAAGDLVGVHSGKGLRRDVL